MFTKSAICLTAVEDILIDSAGTHVRYFKSICVLRFLIYILNGREKSTRGIGGLEHVIASFLLFLPQENFLRAYSPIHLKSKIYRSSLLLGVAFAKPKCRTQRAQPPAVTTPK